MVLFESDRTCCVCRVKGKPVQIHHIDDNPSNNWRSNLAVLCFDCHRDTQITGGFDRKLDADQVILYRDDWHRVVIFQRSDPQTPTSGGQSSPSLEESTSIAEIYRESGEDELSALHYHAIGNLELRDKYIEKAIEKGTDDSWVVFLRSLQQRADLVPKELAEREVNRLESAGDSLGLARAFDHLERPYLSAIAYLEGILKQLRDERPFTAAYYLRELAESSIVDHLFILALEQSQNEGELWWQIRSLQELGWQDDLDDLLIANKSEIEDSGDLLMIELLATAQGDVRRALECRKTMARLERTHEGGVGILDDNLDHEPDNSIDASR